jgi:hypothetical protein
MEIKTRGLLFGDVSKMSRILRKMEIKDEIKKLFSSPSIKEDDTPAEKELKLRKAEEAGADFTATLFVNYCLAETEMDDFVAGLTDLPADQVKKLEFDDVRNILKMFTNSLGGVKGLINFFKSAAR